MKKFAVIVAGGSGTRMGAEVPKQFLYLKSKPLLQYSIEAFLHAYSDMQVILVVPSAYINKTEEIIQQIQANSKIEVVAGGDSRFLSVKNGLDRVSHPSVVFVHDAVRCLVSPELIRNCFGQAVIMGSAIPSVKATDSLRMAEGNHHQVIDRNKVHIIQTPQTFQSGILQKAFRQEYDPSFTDEATVVEASGQEVYLIEGEYNNIKITRPVDLSIAEKLLENYPI